MLVVATSADARADLSEVFAKPESAGTQLLIVTITTTNIDPFLFFFPIPAHIYMIFSLFM